MHAIRLRGPWEFSIAGTQVAGRIELPCDWSELLAALRSASDSSYVIAPQSAITLRRHFHLPTGLETGDCVLLVLRCSSLHVAVQLNGTELSPVEQPDGSHQADVTRELTPRNELTIDVEPPCPAPLHSREPILEATLRIEPAT